MMDSDDDSDSDDGGMCGFSSEEVNTLLSYGVKPWESDAFDFLVTLKENNCY